MPSSSWSSRLLPSGSASNTTPPRAGSSSHPRDKPLPPRPSPAEYTDPPTLNPDRLVPLPSRPRAPSARQHAHNRSASNPLPKIFGRKKSANFNDTDVPLDDSLIPVAGNGAEATVPRTISGKKGKQSEDGKATRKCMCCDSKVNVPKELPRFRCLCCLTINDLRPVEEQLEDDKGRPSNQRADNFPGEVPNGRRPPISLDRTRTVIERCVVTYLEERCQHERDAVQQVKHGRPALDVFGPGAHSSPQRIRSSEDHRDGRRSNSSPGMPSPIGNANQETEPLSTSATIRDFADFELFAGTRMETPPLNAPESSRSPRKPVPTPSRPTRQAPPPPIGIAGRRPSQPSSRRPPTAGPHSPLPAPSPRHPPEGMDHVDRSDRAKSIFKPLEDYIVANFGDFRCLNASFSTVRPAMAGRARSESNIPTPPPEAEASHVLSPMDGLSGMDAKTLLIGDIGENGSWWTGKSDRNRNDKNLKRKKVGEGSKKPVSSRSPNINWADLDAWYRLIHSAGTDWQKQAKLLKADSVAYSTSPLEGQSNMQDIEEDLADAREHAVRTLLKTTENLLKRPSRPLKEPEDSRFLLIILANPSLYPSRSSNRPPTSSDRRPLKRTASDEPSGRRQDSATKTSGREGSQHNGLLKRIFGLVSCSSENCHRYMVGWLARFDEEHLVKLIDLVASFVTYRIGRRPGRARGKDTVDDGGLIPDLSGSTMNTSAQLHSAMGLSGSVKKGPDDPNAEPDWSNDWQIKAAAKVMSLLFAANNIWQGSPRDGGHSSSIPHAKARRSGQLLPTSSFYNTLLDYQDLIADFKIWETRRDKFAFCQYPLFLSMGAKIKILEHDARRQMEIKAREAYFDQVIRQRAIDGHFTLRVRRECMVDDSLRQISAAVGAGQEELKKGLRVQFSGEEGVDAGGPRKEWFLMLVRDIFDPNHGMFVYDEDSQTCYFNANSFETSDQYYLVGALLGLAIYNSTILDISLPSFAFRKLLAAAPTSSNPSSNITSLTGTKNQMTYTLSDLAEFRPSLASGLQQLLDFDGDVEATYCRDFVAPIDRYGSLTYVPLISNGENIPVTNSNRHDFVDAYVRYLLDTAVARQFEPFKRGFFTVCAGNALSLFRAEEIELLIRGSDESLDVDSLRAVAVYENWRLPTPPHSLVVRPAEHVDVIRWFWEVFRSATPERQRMLLTFITGTDRIPAVGATSLVLRIMAGGDGWGGGGREERERFPVARTCFNMLVLWRYESKEVLKGKLWRAVEESEGFALK
ncbi:unnamed protein product [Zymoseptoria tritici ST99CH_3D1]|nr:unnamed protein product [Zymoseptoria tritici ST99CH_3D1]